MIRRFQISLKSKEKRQYVPYVVVVVKDALWFWSSTGSVTSPDRETFSTLIFRPLGQYLDPLWLHDSRN